MTPRKKIHKSPAARVAAVRKRRKAEGMKEVRAWMPAETVDKLDRIVDAKQLDRGTVLTELVNKAKEPAKK